MEPKNGGLQDDFPFNWVIFRFHVNFPGCNFFFRFVGWVIEDQQQKTALKNRNSRSQRDGIEGNIPNSKTVFWCRPGKEDAGTYDAYSPKTTGWNPKNWRFGDLSPFPRGNFSGSMLVCGGVSIHYGWDRDFGTS